MSEPRILIVEGNPPDFIAVQGCGAADQFKATFDALAPPFDYHVAALYATNFETCSLGQFDGVVFTGSGVDWGVDIKEAVLLRTFMEQIFKTDLPVWRSCNGIQLAAIVTGGAVGSSLNGLEVGVAKGIRKPEAGKSYFFALHRRADVLAVLCIHRDEVDRPPMGAAHLAENDHSSMQSFAYRAEAIDFWGGQYHLECPANTIANSLRKGARIFSAAPTLINDLEVGNSDIEAAKRLGIQRDALELEERTRELANWLIHVKDRISS